MVSQAQRNEDWSKRYNAALRNYQAARSAFARARSLEEKRDLWTALVREHRNARDLLSLKPDSAPNPRRTLSPPPARP